MPPATPEERLPVMMLLVTESGPAPEPFPSHTLPPAAEPAELLSNGRWFADYESTKKYADIQHHDIL
jgi:hypothetical protein